MILAGFPASGKTTLLNRAFAEGVQIFGQRNHKYFESFIEANLDPDSSDIGLGEGVNPLKFANTGILLGLAKSSHRIPDVFVVHIDIYNIYKRMLGLKSKVRKGISQQDLSKVRNNEFREQTFKSYVEENFLAHFDEVTINTIVADYSFSKNNFLTRYKKRSFRFFKHLYKREPFFLSRDETESREIYQLFYSVWDKDIRFLNPKHKYKTVHMGDSYSVVRED